MNTAPNRNNSIIPSTAPIVSPGFPMNIELGLDCGYLNALKDFVLMQLQLAAIFFTFFYGTKCHYYSRTILHDDSTRLKKGRGKTRGKGLKKMKKAMGSKMIIEIPIGKGRSIKPIQSAKLSNKLGIISRNFLSLPSKWKELTREEKDAAPIRCHERFEINLDENYVKDSCKDILKNRSQQWRYKLKQKFESSGSVEEARKIENNMKELQALYTSRESSTTIDEIVDVVLGTKSGYIKVLGYGPKPNTTMATQRRTTELEDSLKKVKLGVVSAQNEL
ncbi:hypothetical protein FXO37_27827 [Capsicum annuum]|nr:hypothetical protein FXO37_27827 [Capsicum annuum]